MDDRAFLDGLKDDARRQAGAEFMRKMAGFSDVLKAAKAVPKHTLKLIKENPEAVAGALVAAGALGAFQYSVSKPGKSGTSKEQDAFRGAVSGIEKAEKAEKAEGREAGFMVDLARASTKGSVPIADALARHPGKSALMLGSMFAPAGWAVANKIFK